MKKHQAQQYIREQFVDNPVGLRIAELAMKQDRPDFIHILIMVLIALGMLGAMILSFGGRI